MISNSNVGIQADYEGLVSIVIRALNKGFIIREALESILEQTYQDWVALVVNQLKLSKSAGGRTHVYA